MSRSIVATTIAALAVTCSAGGAPSAWADAAGGSTGPPTALAPSATALPTVAVARGPVSMRVRAAAVLGNVLDFRGSVPSHDSGRTIVIERGVSRSGAWLPAAHAIIDRHGGFVAHWRTSQAGRLAVRAVVVSTRGRAPVRGRSSGAGEASPATRITVYRPALATTYGLGFYGRRTACGQVLTRTSVGVANRHLPCGTMVEMSFAGRRLVLPVIDRGPYANGADWDLTTGAASVLGVPGTVHVGTIIVGRVPSTPTLGSTPGGPTPASGAKGAPTGSPPGAGPTGGATAGS